MLNNELARQVASDHGILLGETGGIESLAAEINRIITTDFNRLIAILYRMGIKDSKLRELLSKNTSTDAGIIIAGMMVDRHKKKVADRARYSKDNKSSEEEKW